VKYLDRFISEKEKADLYAGCLAVAYIPVNEDYGYITLEAFKSHKPVITFTDSGGPNIVVRNDYTGIVTDPDPKELAKAMDMLYNNRKAASEFAQNAPVLLDKLGINWESIIKRLV
jgi:glycosyltransferase involved in cell wall biosynthesis